MGNRRRHKNRVSKNGGVGDCEASSSSKSNVNEGEKKVATDNELYKAFTHLETPKHAWFSVWDIGSRFFLSLVLFYFLLLTHPLSFVVYSYRYFVLEFGTILGTLATPMLPAFPFVLSAIVTYRRIKERWEAQWMQQGPGAIFFTRPKGLAEGFLWDMWLFLGMYTSSFLMTGTNPVAMSHIVKDSVANKWFWRDLFERTGVRYPRLMANWKNGELHVNYPMNNGIKMMSKLVDSYLGIGDSQYQHGKDFSDDEELAASLKKAYGDKDAFLTEFVDCKKSLGVHQLDVLTARINGKIEVLRVLYWGDCSGDTSHSASTGYMCDANTESILAPIRWYSPTYLNQKTGMVGQKLPGMAAAVRECQRLHANCDIPWLNVVGWDCAFTESGAPVVHFEGNYAISRLRRHCFSSLRALYETIRAFAPIPSK